MKLKRFFSAFIVCAVVLTAFAYTAPISAAESTPDTVAVSDYGVNDATIIQKFAADLITLSESEQNEYDFERDGRITVSDASVLQKYLCGIIKELPLIPDETESTVPSTDRNEESTTYPVTEPTQKATEYETQPRTEPNLLELNSYSIELGIGEKFKLSPISDTFGFEPNYISTDENVAVAASDGTITAKASGTAVIKCSLGNGAEASCKVKVLEQPKKIKLGKSSLGLKVGENYEINATSNSGSKIDSQSLEWGSSNEYIVKVKKLDGNNCEIQPVSQGTAYVWARTGNGVSARCKVTVCGSTVKCIDISSWQGDVDFNAVRASGYDYVILRAGFGNEISQKDNRFDSYYYAAKSAGLKVGAYWFSYADSSTDAVLEAKTCLEAIDGKELDMPLYFDVECDYQSTYSKEMMSGICKSFCGYITSNSSYRAGVYAPAGWYGSKLDNSIIGLDYSYWVAQIDGDMSECTLFDLHQYTWVLSVGGISGDVDGNYIYNLNIVDKCS